MKERKRQWLKRLGHKIHHLVLMGQALVDLHKARRNGKDVVNLPIEVLEPAVGVEWRLQPDKYLQVLIDSIKEVGLQLPISVGEYKGNILVYSGMRRIEAYKRLGKVKIPCIRL